MRHLSTTTQTIIIQYEIPRPRGQEHQGPIVQNERTEITYHTREEAERKIADAREELRARVLHLHPNARIIH